MKNQYFNPEFEQIIISTLLQTDDSIKHVVNFLESFHFFKNENKLIYASAKKMYSQKISHSWQAVIQDIQSTKKIDQAGGTSYLIHLSQFTVPVTTQLVYFAHNVRKYYFIRKGQEICTSFTHQLEKDPQGDIGRFLTEMQKKVGTLNSHFNLKNTSLPDDLKEITFENFIPSSDEGFRSKSKKVLQAVKMYAENLTKTIPAGTSILLYGNPGTGKTLLISALANAIRKNGTKFYYVNAHDIDTIYDPRINNQPILLIDHISASLTKNQKEILVNIVRERLFNKIPTICAATMSYEYILSFFDSAIIDRFYQAKGFLLPCFWPSFRGRQQYFKSTFEE